MTFTKKKVVLAYSGGLDTSAILKWLLDKNFEVVCFVADVGQKEDFSLVKEKALQIGASSVHVVDLKEEFVTDYIFPALKSGARYEGTYLMGTSLARPLMALKQVELAKTVGALALAHGCTGKGNDQVRFELVYKQFFPEAEIISPWKDPEFLEKFEGRTDLIKYCKEKGVPISSTLEKPFSMDENLFHCSYEAGILEEIWHEKDYSSIVKNFTLPENSPDTKVQLEITFEAGIPILVKDANTGLEVSGALPIMTYLNMVASVCGVGLVDMVESRFVGMKSRGIYVTPAGTVLWKAHQHLEGITLDKEVIQLKQMLQPKYAQLVYNGFWFSPEMKALTALFEETQKNVSGVVKVQLYKGNTWILGVSSDKSLYNEGIASMDSLGDYNQIDAKGFIAIQALRLQQYARVEVNNDSLEPGIKIEP